MSVGGTVKYCADTAEAEKDLMALEQHAAYTATEVAGVVRKSYTTLVLMGEIMGVVVPAWMNMLVSASLMAGTMFLELAKAETFSGVLAWKAGMTLAAAALMFTQAMVIAKEGAAANRKVAATIQLLNMYTPRIRGV